LTAVALFLLFGTAMASLAGITLIFPGTVLDRAWRLNPVAYAQLAPLGAPVGIVFLLLAALLAVAATGWWRRRRWGWVLAVVIIATQLLGDFVNLLRGNVLRGAVGVAIASALLFYMVRPRVRAAF
jgi:uncharacterized membrane protein (DUF2068 family)